MRPFRVLATILLMMVVAACAGTSTGSSAPSGPGSVAPPGASTGPPPPSTDASASTDAAPSDGGTAVGEDCDERQSEARDAATTLSLTWESINYQVLDDASWADQVAQDWVNAAAYRAAAELLQDLPDYDDDSDRGVWSTHAGGALALAALLDQAATTGTPFADGIGEQIRDDATQLQFDAGTLVHFTVDHMCDDPADDLPAASVEEILVHLVPPSSTEAYRNTSPTYSNFEYESTESVDSLIDYYESTAIPASGWEVFYTDTYGDTGRYWDLVLGTNPMRLFVKVEPSASGSGSKVTVTFTGAG